MFHYALKTLFYLPCRENQPSSAHGTLGRVLSILCLHCKSRALKAFLSQMPHANCTQASNQVPCGTFFWAKHHRNRNREKQSRLHFVCFVNHKAMCVCVLKAADTMDYKVGRPSLILEKRKEAILLKAQLSLGRKHIFSTVIFFLSL